MDLLNDIMEGSFDDPSVPPEQALYIEWTDKGPGKYVKIYNCAHWLKHELYVQLSLVERGWAVTKPSGPNKAKVTPTELGRALLEYYFLMATHASFHNETARRRGKEVDLHKFVELVLQHESIKSLIKDPNAMISA